jgi:hypothetical protein
MVELENTGLWQPQRGEFINKWDTIEAYCDSRACTDFPFTIPQIPVYSSKLRATVENEVDNEVQFLSIHVRHKRSGREIPGYYIANYLRVIDCLDRGLSHYQIWTKENLLYWEERPHKLGKFRDVSNAVLSRGAIGDVQLFRVWGWEMMTVIREDLKIKIEQAHITGCLFTELESVE